MDLCTTDMYRLYYSILKYSSTKLLFKTLVTFKNIFCYLSLRRKQILVHNNLFYGSILKMWRQIISQLPFSCFCLFVYCFPPPKPFYFSSVQSFSHHPRRPLLYSDFKSRLAHHEYSNMVTLFIQNDLFDL